MPRVARIKGNNCNYHIMVRSIDEAPLFKKSEDKLVYFKIISEAQKLFRFKIYAYCLMTNHGHLILDPCGADISKIMHVINFKYARYYNKKYKRRGHLFQDRFNSKVITSNKYLFALSKYIHNNPKDINKYKDCPERYPFSSLGIYFNIYKDKYSILDKNYILKMLDDNLSSAIERYSKYIDIKVQGEDCSNIDVEFEEQGTQYKSYRFSRVNNIKPCNIIEYVAKSLFLEKSLIYIKGRRGFTNARAISVVIMRCICNLSCAEICRELGNITQSRVSKLCSIGIDLLEEKQYKEVFDDFMEKNLKLA